MVLFLLLAINWYVLGYCIDVTASSSSSKSSSISSSSRIVRQFIILKESFQY